MRGFFDWMIAELKRSGLYNGEIVVTTPRRSNSEMLDIWARSHHRFRVSRRGLKNGRLLQVDDDVAVVSRIVDPYHHWPDFLASAENPDITLVVSNTTEAGLAYQCLPWEEAQCPTTFGARLTRWFYHRYRTLGESAPAVDVVPFELVAHNASVLRHVMARHIADWNLPHAFSHWLFAHNAFYNTLVDSIVTSAGPGTLDVVREPYYRLVIDGFGPLSHRLNFAKAGLAVDFVADVTPYQALKIRALNGTHSAIAALGILAGLDTVGAAMADPRLRVYAVRLLREEIVPTLPAFGLAQTYINTFAADVLERFQNPFLAHQLRDIQQNGLAKMGQRLLPTINDYWTRHGRMPPLLALACAAVLLTHREEPAGNWSQALSDPQLADFIVKTEAAISERGWEDALGRALE